MENNETKYFNKTVEFARSKVSKALFTALMLEIVAIASICIMMANEFPAVKITGLIFSILGLSLALIVLYRENKENLHFVALLATALFVLSIFGLIKISSDEIFPSLSVLYKFLLLPAIGAFAFAFVELIAALMLWRQSKMLQKIVSTKE